MTAADKSEPIELRIAPDLFPEPGGMLEKHRRRASQFQFTLSRRGIAAPSINDKAIAPKGPYRYASGVEAPKAGGPSR
jgi:hypothetical protein